MGEEAFAREVGLRYVNCAECGIERRRAGKGFVYLDEKRKRIRDEKTLGRIKALVIPPAWKDVWICRSANGHLQATGRDERGRKQYRYHAEWSKGRNDNKFSRLEHFGSVLPKLRARIEEDLRGRALDRNRVLAAVVQLMERTGMRVGNDEYAATNESYGATTIHNEHAKVTGAKVRFQFKGKSGVAHALELNDAKLARIIRGCQDLPGQELFAYEGEDGVVHDVGSADVNAYLQEATGDKVTAKDIRTWVGSVRAVEALWERGKVDYNSLTKKAKKERECGVIKDASTFLGNTVAVCRKYYVHPAVFEADRDGYLFRPRSLAASEGVLTPGEAMLLAVLKKYRHLKTAGAA